MQFLRHRLWAYAIPIVIAAAGIGSRVHQWYFSRTLWLDEEMIFLNIRDRMFSELIGPLWLYQTAPLGWLALQRLVLQLAGESDRAVRALSVLFAMATLAGAAWIGIRWMRPIGATLLLVLFGVGQWVTFYALEAKPYAADGFWALMLPALAVWVVEADKDGASLTRRSLVWWITATIGQWISYGALFVAPGCALLLCGVAWRRGGPRRALTVALYGLPWLASFAAHYYLVLRHAASNENLADYWASGLPPSGTSIWGALTWLAQQAEPLASHPGGTTLWWSFWLVVAYGIAATARNRPVVAFSWLLVVVSACVYALVGFVPLKDRVAFWTLPALYVAIALAADSSVALARSSLTRRRRLIPFALAALAAVLVWPPSIDIAKRGERNLILPSDNHGFDDHAGVRFLMAQRQPGDVLIATQLGLPALWWYGGIGIADPHAGGRHPEDGAAILELRHHWPRSGTCERIDGKTQPQRALSGARRAAVFLGFDSGIPPGLQELALNSLNEFARLVSFKLIASEGTVAIFDLTLPPDPDLLAVPQRWGRYDSPVLPGCVSLRPARRW